MTGSFPIPRRLVILAIVLPLAVLIGYSIAGPLTYTSLAVYCAVVGVLVLPAVLAWHHPLMIFSLNAAIDVFFLPGKPQLWMVLVCISLTVSVLSRLLNPEMRWIQVPSIAWALGAFVLVVLVTAKLTGGISLRSLGGNLYGGKKYVYIFLAVVVYLAISVRKIPIQKANAYVGAYFLSYLTAIVSNLVYIAGPGLWWLFVIFPVGFAEQQVMEDFSMSTSPVKFARLGSLGPLTLSVLCYLLARNGIRGMFDLSKPWRLAILVITLGAGLLSGFRSSLVQYALIFGIQFCLEGLVRTRLFAGFVIGAILGFLTLIPIADKLPLSVQRSLSMLPLNVDTAARADAENTTQWRLEMWKVLLPEVPKYFWIGKGYTTSATDFYLAEQSRLRGFARDYETSIVAGDYHNGPLSVIIPFGIWGLLAFLAFVTAGLRVLYLNYRHGDPALKSINTLLLSYFIARLIFFAAVFGALHADLVLLTSIIGLSVSLNGGVRKPVAAPSATAATAAAEPLPAARPQRASASPMRMAPWRRG